MGGSWVLRDRGEVEAVEDHRPVVVELGEFVAVEQDAVLAVADNLHIGFEDLGEKFLRNTRLM